jgi:hypothetical protein
VVGSCKYGDEPLGSGATELVSYKDTKNPVSKETGYGMDWDYIPGKGRMVSFAMFISPLGLAQSFLSNWYNGCMLFFLGE